MKRIISLLLVIILFTLPLSLSYAETRDSFKSTFTKSITDKNNVSASKWFATDQNRAIATVFLAVDVFSHMDTTIDTNKMIEFLNNTSYVGLSSSSNQILVLGYYGSTNTNILVIIYTPSTDDIEYLIMEFSDSKIADSTMDGILLQAMLSFNNNKEYYKNDKALVLETMNTVIDIRD